MAKELEPKAAKAAAAPAAPEPAASEFVAAEDVVVAEPEKSAPPAAEAAVPQDGGARGKLALLFAHLKITKIVFVDDKAELQTDAGAVIKVLG